MEFGAGPCGSKGGHVRLWTLQSPKVVATVAENGVYRASWDRVTVNWRPAYRAMVAEMERRDIACHGAPPVWCWPGRAWRRGPVRMTAELLLGDHEWARGVCLVRLSVPRTLTLTTSYAEWNDYLGVTMALLAREGRSDGPAFDATAAPMDWSGALTHDHDSHQIVIPELRREWIIDSRPYPPSPDTAARIAADPVLRDYV